MKELTKVNFKKLFDDKQLYRVAVCYDCTPSYAIEKIESHCTKEELERKIVLWQESGSNTTNVDINGSQCKLFKAKIWDYHFIGLCFTEESGSMFEKRTNYTCIIYHEL